MPYFILKNLMASASPFCLVCDHASKQLPEEISVDALSEEDFKRHISHDVGAAEVTQLLAEMLPATAFLAEYSRLLVDLNRASDNEDVIPEISDGTHLPFNQNLSQGERAVRLLRYHTVYHAKLNEEVSEHFEHHGQQALAILMHSFTPSLSTSGEQRPWHIGLLWRDDKETADRLREWLSVNTDYVIGDNQPYSGFSEASYTMRKHFGAIGISHIAIEIRQDLISDSQGQKKMAAILAQALKSLRSNAQNADVKKAAL